MNEKMQLKNKKKARMASTILESVLLLLFLWTCWGCSQGGQNASCEYHDEPFPEAFATPSNPSSLERARQSAKSGPLFLQVQDDNGKPLAGAKITFRTTYLKEDKFASRVFVVRTGKDGYAEAPLENALLAFPIEIVLPEGYELARDLPMALAFDEGMNRDTPLKFVVNKANAPSSGARFMFNATGRLTANAQNAANFTMPGGKKPEGDMLDNLTRTSFIIDVVNGSWDEPKNTALPQRVIIPTLTIQCVYKHKKSRWELQITGQQRGGKVQDFGRWHATAPSSGWEDSITFSTGVSLPKEKFIGFKTDKGQYGFLYLTGFEVHNGVFQASFSAWLNPYGDKCLVPGRFGKLDHNFGLFKGFYVADGQYKQYACDPWGSEKELRLSPNYEPEWLKNEIARHNEQFPDNSLTPDKEDYNGIISEMLMREGGDWRIAPGRPWEIILAAVESFAGGKLPECPDFAGMIAREEFIIEPELYKKVLQGMY